MSFEDVLSDRCAGTALRSGHDLVPSDRLRLVIGSSTERVSDSQLALVPFRLVFLLWFRHFDIIVGFFLAALRKHVLDVANDKVIDSAVVNLAELVRLSCSQVDHSAAAEG